MRTNPILLLMAVASLSVPVESARPQAQAEAARRTVQAMMERAGIPALQATVAVNGKVVSSQAFGRADLEQQVAVTASTRFRIGSASKPFAAAALGRLVDEHRIDLDAPIKRYVPSVPSETLTVRQVAGHLSGIRNYRARSS